MQSIAQSAMQSDIEFTPPQLRGVEFSRWKARQVKVDAARIKKNLLQRTFDLRTSRQYRPQTSPLIIANRIEMRGAVDWE